MPVAVLTDVVLKRTSWRIMGLVGKLEGWGRQETL